MSSAAQALANRQNSLQSTGPVTAAGKAASSRNSTRHGLTSKQIVLVGEDAAHYDELRAGFLADYAPGNAVEIILVEEVAAASWRLMRARRHETLILQKMAGDNADSDAAFAAAFMEKPKEVARLTRYITTIERAFYRAMSKLAQVQKERFAAERKAELEAAALELSGRPRTRSGNGFVSQNRSAAATAQSGELSGARMSPLRAAPLPLSANASAGV
jgi:hypothetical protein